MENNRTGLYPHRMGTITLKLTDATGSPLAGKELDIQQTRHQFLFGCGEFYAAPYLNGQYANDEKETVGVRLENFIKLFNFATLPFYWGGFERVKGSPDTARMLKAAKWLKSRGLALKGHPLCWHSVCADWLMELSNEEIFDTQLKRINREMTGFKGTIDMWDVINEVVIMPIFDKYDNAITRICKEKGRIKLVREVFAAARKANPEATLLINDFDTSESYDILIEGLLESGIVIDAIGIQSHMHQGYWGVEKTMEVLDRFSRFGLPIHFTENTLLSGHIMPPEIVDLNDYQVAEWPSTPEGEERQAREVALHYKTLFGHPQVASITWWDFVDGSWLKAPSGLSTKDNRLKPAYHELYNLIKGEWWMKPARYVTDASGSIQLTGYLGDYEAVCDGKTMPFTLGRNQETSGLCLD